MKDRPFNLVVNKPMRISIGQDKNLLGVDIIPSLQVLKDESLPNLMLKAFYEYQCEFRDKPTHFTLSPHNYLSFVATIADMQRVPSMPRFGDSVDFNGIPVIPVLDGLLGVNLKNLSHVVWKINSKS